MPLSENLRARFQSLITTNKVVLFMKGTRGAPACGFSAACVQILDEMNKSKLEDARGRAKPVDVYTLLLWPALLLMALAVLLENTRLLRVP